LILTPATDILGADITDYFNYGFTEDTWKIYSQRQNILRSQNGYVLPNILPSNRMTAKGISVSIC